eukprot:gene12789-biopygen4797
MHRLDLLVFPMLSKKFMASAARGKAAVDAKREPVNSGKTVTTDTRRGLDLVLIPIQIAILLVAASHDTAETRLGVSNIRFHFYPFPPRQRHGSATAAPRMGTNPGGAEYSQNAAHHSMFSTQRAVRPELVWS